MRFEIYRKLRFKTHVEKRVILIFEATPSEQPEGTELMEVESISPTREKNHGKQENQLTSPIKRLGNQARKKTDQPETKPTNPKGKKQGKKESDRSAAGARKAQEGNGSDSDEAFMTIDGFLKSHLRSE